MVPWTLELEIGGRGDWRWLGFFGEKSERVARFFWRDILEGEFWSDKYRGVRIEQM